MKYRGKIVSDKPETDSKTIIIIDMDEVCFKVAAAGEYFQYQSKDTGNIKLFKNKGEFRKLLKDYPDCSEEDFILLDEKIPEEESFVYHSIKTIVNELSNRVEADEVKLFIGGKDNFRERIPLPVKYKGNREDLVRPILLDKAKGYAINILKAQVVNGCEADDMLALSSHQLTQDGHKAIAATQDKDSQGVLKTFTLNPWLDDADIQWIDGLGELWIKNGEVKGVGYRWLMAQTLLGDSTDNYNPRDIVKQLTGKSPIYGPQKCIKGLMGCNTEKECLEYVISKYNEWYEPLVCDVTGYIHYQDFSGNYRIESIIEILNMYFQCARMLTNIKEPYTILDEFKKYGVKCEFDYVHSYFNAEMFSLN